MGIVITEIEFFNKLSRNEFQGEEIEVLFRVNLDSTISGWDFKNFKNITFHEKVIIKDINLKSGIEFINCNFKKGIYFINIKSTDFDVNINSNNCSIKFDSCLSKIICFSEKCYIERSLRICNNSNIEKLEIRYLKILNEGLVINKSNLEYLDIFNSSFEINLSQSIFSKPLRILSLKGNIAFVSNEFNDWLKLWNIECSYGITFNKNVFKEKFNIEGSKIKRLSIVGDVFEKKAELENRDLSGNNLETYLNKLYISEAKFTEGFDFNGLGKPIEKIELPLSPIFQGLLKFVGWQVDDLYLSGINQNLKLLFKNISFRFFMINDFTNYSDISFDKCKGYEDCTLNLSDCDLGSTKFNEFEFDSFLSIRINNATLDKIKPTSSNWFKENSLEIGDGTQTNEEEFKRKREIYRQIKQALKNNGNQIDSLIFQARELSAYKKELELSKEKTFGDKVIMCVSKTNDFGLNWTKPVWIVFFVTFIVFLIVLPAISDKIDYKIAKSRSDLSITWDVLNSNFNIFWQLFNPIRQVKLIFGDNKFSGWIYLIDLLHRIFLGIMIFQIIKAFRKFVSY